MKNQKIIKVERSNCEEVLIQIRRDDDAGDYVEISAWHNTDHGKLLQLSSVKFENFDNDELNMQNFIRDYSTDSAIDFIESFNL